MKKIKKVFAVMLVFVCLFLVVGCNKLPQPETNLEFWIAERVDDVDFSEFQIKQGMFGGYRYYGTGYLPSVDENGYQIDPECCVIYTVTSYPDYSSKALHVTRIEITDPEIKFYGLSLNSSKEEIKNIMEKNGFTVEEDACAVYATKGKFSFSF